MAIKEDIIQLQKKFGEDIIDSPNFPNILSDSSDYIQSIHNGCGILRDLYKNNFRELLAKISTKPCSSNKKKHFDNYVDDFCKKTKYEYRYVRVIAETIIEARGISLSKNDNEASKDYSSSTAIYRKFQHVFSNAKFVTTGCAVIVLLFVSIYGLKVFCKNQIFSDITLAHVEFQNGACIQAATRIATSVTKYPGFLIENRLKDSLYFEFENSIIIMSQQCKNASDIYNMRIWLNEFKSDNERISRIIDNRKQSLKLLNSN